MTEITVKAYAKLNISLDVLYKMENGYHAVRMVMQTADLCDDISLKLIDNGSISAKTNLKYLPCDQRNIAVKAAEVFLAEIGATGMGVEIIIKKRIPVCAGLGGGSSDGAAVLRALNEMTNAGLGREKLEELGGRLGSDVPFCVAGGTALAEGRGEVLRDLHPLPDCDIVICKPEFSISTPDLFSKIDEKVLSCHPDTDGIISALEGGDIKGVSRRMYNVFEGVQPRQSRELGEIRGKLLDFHALGVVMSGTGSAMFGIFGDPEKARRAYEELKEEYEDCFLTKPVKRLDV